jgi:hypothetical protein
MAYKRPEEGMMAAADAQNDRFQTEPIEDQHEQPLDDKVRGIIVQEEADLAGHDETEVLTALRQRFNDAGIAVPEDELIEQARRIAGAEQGRFSNGGDASA